jgi:hypothetical protein
MVRLFTAGAIVLLSATAAVAAAAAGGDIPPAPNVDASKIVCKYVVAATPGSKPYRLCMSKGDWALKDNHDNKDANRIVCHYEEEPGSRLQGRKVCQPASRWADDKQLYRETTEKIQMGTAAPH